VTQLIQTHVFPRRILWKRAGLTRRCDELYTLKFLGCYFLSNPYIYIVREETRGVIYRMLQEESNILGENFPWRYYCRHNQAYFTGSWKLRRLWREKIMVFFRVFLPYQFNRMRYLNTTQFSKEPIAKPRHTVTSVIYKALRTVTTMCMKLMRFLI
jgi:hypothetical protein